MRVGISIAQAGRLADPAAVRAAATAAEQVGYSSVWVCDVLPAPEAAALDPLGVLAVAALVTERVRLGTSVLVAPWYRPAVLARAVATLHQISERRLVVGLGTEAPPDPVDDDTLDALAAALDAIDGTWPPQGRPPVLLDAVGPAGLDLVARRADGWNPAGVAVDDLAATWCRVRDLAAGHGRDPEALSLVVRADVELTDRPQPGARRPYCGSLDQVAADLAATATAGAGEVILGIAGDPTLDEALDCYARLAEALEAVAA